MRASRTRIRNRWQQLDASTVAIYCSNHRGEAPEVPVLVDSWDFHAWLKEHSAKWFVNACGYVQAHGPLGRVYTSLHSLILGYRNNGSVIDHINRDKLDNRRQNLRRTTQSLNGLNSKIHRTNKSGYLGVQVAQRGYRVVIRSGGKTHYREFGSDLYAACDYARTTYILLGVPGSNLPPLPEIVSQTAA